MRGLTRPFVKEDDGHWIIAVGHPVIEGLDMLSVMYKFHSNSLHVARVGVGRSDPSCLMVGVPWCLV